MRNSPPTMPEGDTLERIARRLMPMVGATPVVTAPHPRTRPSGIPDRLAGATVTAIEARGKHLLIGFDNGLTLHSHLRMSGRWEIARPGTPPRRRDRPAWLELTTPALIARQFDGPVLELLTRAQLGLHPALRRLGGDALDPVFDIEAATTRARMVEPEATVADLLLDQTVIAGVGNVWKSEVLFDRRLDPRTPVHALNDATLRDLLDRAATLMRQHVESGAQRRPTRIYGRARRACPVCGSRIRSEAQGDEGRVTFWCPTCQRGSG
jgi:endonuclease-8